MAVAVYELLTILGWGSEILRHLEIGEFCAVKLEEHRFDLVLEILHGDGRGLTHDE